jgi:hypothetical protein
MQAPKETEAQEDNMLTVMEMLSHPTFSDFRLITKRTGLNNRIRNAGILDWESGEALDDAFSPGDFVVTTLAPYRDEPEIAELVIEALIKKNISALAIKDVYFSTIPGHIAKLAEKHRIPVFMFSEPGIADVIHALKNEMSFLEINRQATRRLREILYQTADEADIDILARDINPFFTNNLICAFAIPLDPENKKMILAQMAAGYQNYLNAVSVDPEASYSILFFSVGICIIYTDLREDRNLKDDLRTLVDQFSVDLTGFAVGFSDQMHRLSDISLAAKQAIYASADARMNDMNLQNYSDMGITRALCPLRSDYWMRSYYDDMLDRISNYDKEHDAHLFETITDYVRCDGDISATAEISYQHPNTIRYRIKKAQEVLGTKNSMDFRTQLYVLVRLSEINNLLVDWRL